MQNKEKMDKEFLKKLTILYVEDDELIAKELSSTIEKLFKKIIVAKNGQDGLDKYNQNKDEINLIISDISMPIMNGVELLKNVRKEDLKIPFIFTTAFTDKEYLVDSLKQGVHDYFIKPINLNELLIKIEKVAKKVEHESVINNYQSMIKEYINTINKVAIVFVFDLKGKLIFTNDFLKELGNYSDEDILEKDYRELYHKDVANDIITKQFEEVMLGNKWNGNLKFTTKDDGVFYANTTIMPLKENEKINKFICINFITTKEENSRREFKKKVLYNFQETKKIFKKAQEKINEVELALSKYVGYDIKEKEFIDLRDKNNNYLSVLQEVESKIKKTKNRQELFTYEINTKIKQISESTNKMNDFSYKSKKKITKIKYEIKIREHFIEKVNKEIEEKNQKIEDLQDVLSHRDSQLEEKNRI